MKRLATAIVVVLAVSLSGCVADPENPDLVQHECGGFIPGDGHIPQPTICEGDEACCYRDIDAGEDTYQLVFCCAGSCVDGHCQ